MKKINDLSVKKFLDMYIENRRIQRYSILSFGSGKMIVGQQLMTFCNRDNIEIVEAPVNDHRAVGLVERLIQTIRNGLACIKEEKSANN